MKGCETGTCKKFRCCCAHAAEEEKGGCFQVPFDILPADTFHFGHLAAKYGDLFLVGVGQFEVVQHQKPFSHQRVSSHSKLRPNFINKKRLPA